MKLRKVLMAVLTVTLLLAGGPLTVMAADVKPEAPVNPIDLTQQHKLPYTIGVEAEVTQLNLTDTKTPSVTVKTAGEKGQEITLNISEDTIFADTKTGLSVKKTDLKKGDKIYAYHDAAMTRSIPPQTHAQAILVNFDSKHAPAHLLTAEKVTSGVDGKVTFLAENGSILVTVGKDTPITPFLTKNVVKNSDIHMGTRVLAWYDIVAMSMPGQTQATKVVVLPNLDREVTMLTQGDIAIGKAKVENGVVMVPLRLTAEKLGYTVTWDGKTETVGLNGKTARTTVALGQDSYYKAAAEGLIGMTKPMSLGAAAYEVNGVSWAPAELFNLLTPESGVQLVGNILFL